MMFSKTSNCGVIMLEQQERIKIEDAAKIMGVTPMFIRMGLRRKRLPFGTAVFMNKRWTYYINGKKFRQYMQMESDA